METQDTIAADASPPHDGGKTKTRRRRIKKLAGAELVGLPGATAPTAKAPEPELTHYICFVIPLTGSVGTVSEAGEIHDFAFALHQQANNAGVGTVATVTFANASSEVVLKLSAEVDPSAPSVPVANAFSELGGTLSSASVLGREIAGRRAMWRAKINGTTIAQGQY